MKCNFCSNEIPAGSVNCPACGAPVPTAQGQYQQVPPTYQPLHPNYQILNPAKSRVAYILLAIFVGGLGVHNFYAGYTGKGVAQLLISIISCGALSFISWIWAIIEVCTVTTDADGIPME